MDMQETKTRFDASITHCDNLLAVHAGSRTTQRGRRHQEASLNRAAIVLAVAAWQSVIENLTLAALDAAAPSTQNIGLASLLRGDVNKQVGAYSTPNSENSRNLLKLVDYDPFSSWSWDQPTQGRSAVRRTTPNEVSREINAWLSVRHAIAHGHPFLPIVDQLESVKQAVNKWIALQTGTKATRKQGLDHLIHKGFEPSVRLSDAKEVCQLFQDAGLANSERLGSARRRSIRLVTSSGSAKHEMTTQRRMGSSDHVICSDPAHQ